MIRLFLLNDVSSECIEENSTLEKKQYCIKLIANHHPASRAFLPINLNFSSQFSAAVKCREALLAGLDIFSPINVT